MNSSNLKIANIMLGRGLGGIEQAFLDYNEALLQSGYRTVPIISRGASIEPQLRDSGLGYLTLRQWGWWDIPAARRLFRILQKEEIAAVIAHGNRALSLVSLGTKALPVISVVQNYNVARVGKAHAVVVTTADLKNFVTNRQGMADNLYIIPNVTRVTKPPPAAAITHDPPIVGTMGRMVEKKGFGILCDALATLKSQGVSFNAVIAGDGAGRPRLKRQIRSLGLDDNVRLTGWVDGKAAKDAFWTSIDIFCLPSLHEPFGIVLLEAWAAGKPVITTDTEGPCAIAADNVDAIIVPRNNPDAMAQSVRLLLQHPEKAHALAINGYQKVRANYTVRALASGLNVVLGKVLS